MAMSSRARSHELESPAMIDDPLLRRMAADGRLAPRIDSVNSGVVRKKVPSSSWGGGVGQMQ